MGSSTTTRYQAARQAIARSAIQTTTPVRVDCNWCQPPYAFRDHNGAIEHARLNPGHIVTVRVLQSTTYGRTEVTP